jgi:glutaredoxin
MKHADELGYDIVERDFYEPSVLEWEELIGYTPTTAPQIFVDGEHLGGCVDFIEWTES